MSFLSPFATDPRHLFHYDDDEQRCDAKHPCTPCIDGGFDCVYEQSPVTKHVREELSPVVQPFPFPFSSEPNPLGSPSSRINNKDASLSTSGVASSDIGRTVFSSTDTNLPRDPLEKSRSPEPDPPAPHEGSNSEMQLVHFREESPRPHQPRPTAIFTFSLLPSLRFPSIPRQLHTPLSFMGPENLQVSNTALSELDLSLCVSLFFGDIQTSQELTTFNQPACSTTAVETVWDLSRRPQARRYNAWR